MFNNDVTIRKSTTTAPREIKSSAHFAYIDRGITLDGSKFAVGELVLEGTCLARNAASGKYEKYADGAASQATIEGANNITPADLSGVHADTAVTITVNGIAYVWGNASIKGIGAATTEAQLITAVKTAVNGKGVTIDKVANVAAVGNKLRITTLDEGSGQSVAISGVWGAAANEAAVEGVLGMAIPSSDVGTGAFPEGYDNPVILDESIKIPVDDAGANVDVTAGQVLVHGAVYTGMLIGCTAAFKAETRGAILYR